MSALPPDCEPAADYGGPVLRAGPSFRQSEWGSACVQEAAALPAPPRRITPASGARLKEHLVPKPGARPFEPLSPPKDGLAPWRRARFFLRAGFWPAFSGNCYTPHHPGGAPDCQAPEITSPRKNPWQLQPTLSRLPKYLLRRRREHRRPDGGSPLPAKGAERNAPISSNAKVSPFCVFTSMFTAKNSPLTGPVRSLLTRNSWIAIDGWKKLDSGTRACSNLLGRLR